MIVQKISGVIRSGKIKKLRTKRSFCFVISKSVYPVYSRLCPMSRHRLIVTFPCGGGIVAKSKTVSAVFVNVAFKWNVIF